MCVRVYTAGHYLQNGAGMGFDSMPLLLAPLRQRSVELSYTYEQIQTIHCFLNGSIRSETLYKIVCSIYSCTYNDA